MDGYLQVFFSTTTSPSSLSKLSMRQESHAPSIMRSPGHHSSSMLRCSPGLWQWRVKMTGMEARRQRLMVVLRLEIIGVAMEEKWFCTSMTKRTHDFGFGFRLLVSYFVQGFSEDVIFSSFERQRTKFQSLLSLKMVF